MFKERMTRGLLVSAAALSFGCGVAAAQESGPAAGGVIADAAAVLAARSDVFQATSASLDVVPVDLAGSCPQAYAFNVRLGARSPGKLSYRIVTEDGRESQLFEASAVATADGLFAVQASHKLALAESAQTEEDPSIVVFEVPEKLKQREPDFFERLFGTGPAADDDTVQGLREQAFMVQVVAPNAVASAFDSHTVSCEEQRETRILPVVFEDQRDGRDRPDRDPGEGSGSEGGGRDRDPGRDPGGPAGAR